MGLTSTIFFVIAGLMLVALILVVTYYRYWLEQAHRRIDFLENQLTEIRREKELVEERLDYVRKYYALKERTIK